MGNFSYFPALGACFKYYIIWVLCPQLSNYFFFSYYMLLIVSSIVLVNDDFNVSVAS